MPKLVRRPVVAPRSTRPDPSTTMAGVLRRLDPAAEAAARFAYSEVRRRGGIPREVDFETWLVSAIVERSALLVESMVGGIENQYKINLHADRVESNLIAFTYRGRKALLAAQLGTACGYAEGRLFVNLINDEWADEFEPGKDFEVISGAALQDLKKALVLDDNGKNPLSWLGKSARAMLLFESGIWKALLLTKKKPGKDLRRWLSDTVLPEIAQTGGYTSGMTEAQVRAMLDARDQRILQQQEASLSVGLAKVEGRLDHVARHSALEAHARALVAEQKADDAALRTGATEKALQIVCDRLGPGAYQDGLAGIHKARQIIALMKQVAEARGCTFQMVNVDLRSAFRLQQRMRWEYLDCRLIGKVLVWLLYELDKAKRGGGGNSGGGSQGRWW